MQNLDLKEELTQILFQWDLEKASEMIVKICGGKASQN